MAPQRPSTGSLASLLLLADGRFPAGGHVHSGGMEAAIADGRVRSLDDVEQYVVGRLHTVGLADAALTAATVLRLADGAEPVASLRAVEAEVDARLPVRELRVASRRLGRQLARVAVRCWPDPVFVALADLHPDGPHQAVALGAACTAAAADAVSAATVSLHHTMTIPLQAALRLGALDPHAVAALAASLHVAVESLSQDAASAAAGPLGALPCTTGPLCEIAAVAHAADDSRLFAT